MGIYLGGIRIAGVALIAAALALPALAADNTSNTDSDNTSQTRSGPDTSVATICSDTGLSVSDQSACRTQMSNATSEAQRDQIRRSFEARKTGASSATNPSPRALGTSPPYGSTSSPAGRAPSNAPTERAPSDQFDTPPKTTAPPPNY